LTLSLLENKKMKANFLFRLLEKKFPIRESKEFHPYLKKEGQSFNCPRVSILD